MDAQHDIGAAGDLLEYFDGTVEYWHSLYDGSTFIQRHMCDRKHIVLNEVAHISRGQPLRILDLGSGTGILTYQLLQRGHSVAAVDGAAKMLAKLQQMLSKSSPNDFLGAIQADVNQIPFDNAQFDMVVCVGVVQYQRDENRVLSEISRVLKPAGCCILTLPNLLTVSHITDPIYGVRFARRLWRRGFRKTEPPSGNSGAFRIVGEYGGAEPYNKKYLKSEVSPFLHRCGLRLKKEIAYGFGPLTVATREFLPDRFSVPLSDTMTRIALRPSMRWLAYFANRWVLVAEKE